MPINLKTNWKNGHLLQTVSDINPFIELVALNWRPKKSKKLPQMLPRLLRIRRVFGGLEHRLEGHVMCLRMSHCTSGLTGFATEMRVWQSAKQTHARV